LWYITWYVAVVAGDPLDRLADLLASPSDDTAGTSVRLPANLRAAATVAAEMGYATSIAELSVRGLRDVLEAIALRAALDAHYAEHPGVRPSLVEVALAAAEMDGVVISVEEAERAASWLESQGRTPTPDEVVLVAAGIGLAGLPS